LSKCDTSFSTDISIIAPHPKKVKPSWIGINDFTEKEQVLFIIITVLQNLWEYGRIFSYLGKKRGFQ